MKIGLKERVPKKDVHSATIATEDHPEQKLEMLMAIIVAKESPSSKILEEEEREVAASTANKAARASPALINVKERELI